MSTLREAQLVHLVLEVCLMEYLKRVILALPLFRCLFNSCWLFFEGEYLVYLGGHQAHVVQAVLLIKPAPREKRVDFLFEFSERAVNALLLPLPRQPSVEGL